MNIHVLFIHFISNFQAFLKTKIMDNIQKYVYLICFTGYLREQSKIAKDAGAEEFKLTGGKGISKIHI